MQAGVCDKRSPSDDALLCFYNSRCMSLLKNVITSFTGLRRIGKHAKERPDLTDRRYQGLGLQRYCLCPIGLKRGFQASKV